MTEQDFIHRALAFCIGQILSKEIEYILSAKDRKNKTMIEFSNIQITKATHEAVKGCAELGEMTEQDFIHRALAFCIGQILSKEIEYILLEGKSLEEDVELLRRYIALRKEGKMAVFSSQVTSSQNVDTILKALNTVEEELVSLGENSMGKFDLVLRNVGYEAKRTFMGNEMISSDLTIENEEEVREKQERFRQGKRVSCV